MFFKTFKTNFILSRVTTILALAVLITTLGAAISGVLIAFYYEPAAGSAYDSLGQIYNNTAFGWLVYSVHHWAGKVAIAISLVQIIVMFLSRQFRSSWFTAWVSGILLTLATMGLSWTAMSLAWNQESFWRLKVELGIISSIPLIGDPIRAVLTGGNGVNTTAIVHFYTLHSYVLSLGADRPSLDSFRVFGVARARTETSCLSPTRTPP